MQQAHCSEITRQIENRGNDHHAHQIEMQRHNPRHNFLGNLGNVIGNLFGFDNNLFGS